MKRIANPKSTKTFSKKKKKSETKRSAIKRGGRDDVKKKGSRSRLLRNLF